MIMIAMSLTNSDTTFSVCRNVVILIPTFRHHVLTCRKIVSICVMCSLEAFPTFRQYYYVLVLNY